MWWIVSKNILWNYHARVTIENMGNRVHILVIEMDYHRFLYKSFP